MSDQNENKLPWGGRRVWHCRSEAVDFLKNEGGPFGVKLTLDLANAKKLRSALKTCTDIATKAGVGKVEIDARWGKRGGKTGEKGFRLDIMVR